MVEDVVEAHLSLVDIAFVIKALRVTVKDSVSVDIPSVMNTRRVAIQQADQLAEHLRVLRHEAVGHCLADGGLIAEPLALPLLVDSKDEGEDGDLEHQGVYEDTVLHVPQLVFLKRGLNLVFKRFIAWADGLSSVGSHCNKNVSSLSRFFLKVVFLRHIPILLQVFL